MNPLRAPTQFQPTETALQQIESDVKDGDYAGLSALLQRMISEHAPCQEGMRLEMRLIPLLEKGSTSEKIDRSLLSRVSQFFLKRNVFSILPEETKDIALISRNKKKILFHSTVLWLTAPILMEAFSAVIRWKKQSKISDIETQRKIERKASEIMILKEKEGEISKIKIRDFSSQVILGLKEFLYTGDLDPARHSFMRCCALLSFAGAYAIKGLKEIAFERIKSAIPKECQDKLSTERFLTFLDDQQERLSDSEKMNTLRILAFQSLLKAMYDFDLCIKEPQELSLPLEAVGLLGHNGAIGKLIEQAVRRLIVTYPISQRVLEQVDCLPLFRKERKEMILFLDFKGDHLASLPPIIEKTLVACFPNSLIMRT